MVVSLGNFRNVLYGTNEKDRLVELVHDIIEDHLNSKYYYLASSKQPDDKEIMYSLNIPLDAGELIIPNSMLASEVTELLNKALLNGDLISLNGVATEDELDSFTGTDKPVASLRFQDGRMSEDVDSALGIDFTILDKQLDIDKKFKELEKMTNTVVNLSDKVNKLIQEKDAVEAPEDDKEEAENA